MSKTCRFSPLANWRPENRPGDLSNMLSFILLRTLANNILNQLQLFIGLFGEARKKSIVISDAPIDRPPIMMNEPQKRRSKKPIM